MPITHIHDWSLYRLFTSLLHTYMTDSFTGYLHPYYTFTWLVPLLVIYIPITHITWPFSLLVIYIPITHIHDWSLYRLFTSLLHTYMTDSFTGYLHPYYTFTWLVPLLVIYIPITHITWPVSLLVIYIPITHIHDWSLNWLLTCLLHIYMTDPFTDYLHPYYTHTWLIPLLVIYIPITHLHD